jgi:nucleolar protein 56
MTDDTEDAEPSTTGDAAETPDTAASLDAAWFAAGSAEPLTDRVREGSADAPADWPALAVESGFAEDEAHYEAMLRETTMAAAREAVRERERADDQQLIHAIRAMDDTRRTANELAERVAEWGGSLFELDDGSDGDHDTAEAGVEYAREVTARDTEDDPAAEPAVALAQQVVALADEADELEAFVEETAPVVAPNLAALAGPILAARLISLAGGLGELAKKPSGTVQVLGAEDALFAHLHGNAPSPKHGAIFTHDYVRNTHPEDRGSAARALAGKLSIAARIDHYSGDYRPDLEAELDERIRTIRARQEGGQ